MLQLQSKENRRKIRQLMAAFSFLVFVSIYTVQATPTTFATFSQRNPGLQNFVFTNNGLSGGSEEATFNTVAGGNPVRFFYDEIVVAGLPVELQDQQNATLTLTSTTNSPATVSGVTDINQPVSGTLTMAIIRNVPASTGGGSKNNLLTITVTFSGGGSASNIFGSSNSLTYSASTPSSTNQSVTYSSDFLDFTQTNARNFSIGFSSVNPSLSIASNGILNSFAASGTTTVASDPPPFYNPPTSSSVNVGGRILTAGGRAVSRAQVSLTDSNGTTRVAYSNGFGYYRFSEVQAGQTVVIAVSAKRYTFASQVISVTDELTGVNFMALE